MTKSRRGKSVLSRQKPKRGRVRPLKERLQRWGIGASCACLVCGVLFLAWRVHKLGDELLATDGVKPIPWRVSIKLVDDTPLAPKAQADLVATARRLLGRGTRKDLTRTAQALQQLDSYADVHILRLAQDEVAVQVRQRTPALCIEADRLRYVSTAGEVYGQTDVPASCPGPVLTGVFDPGVHVGMRADLTLALNDDDRGVVTEATALLKEARAKGFTITRMEAKKYRGLFVTLAGADTEVAIGRAPFAAKLDRLQGILAKLAAKNEQAARIELDYQGKAFIKLKKM